VTGTLVRGSRPGRFSTGRSGEGATRQLAGSRSENRAGGGGGSNTGEGRRGPRSVSRYAIRGPAACAVGAFNAGGQRAIRVVTSE